MRDRNNSNIQEDKKLVNQINITPEQLSDLRKSGLKNETIVAAGIHAVPPRDIAKIIGRTYGNQINSLLAFPYLQDGDFCRYKLFPPIKDKDGHKIKYFQSQNSGVHLYFPPGIETIINDTSIPISFVEGEKKALEGYQEGITTIGIGGIWNFKEKDDDRLISDFDSIPLNGRVINLIPDGDYQKNKSIQKAIFTLAEKLKQRGAEPYLISLPDNEPRIGLDDFLVQYGVGAFWELPREKVEIDPYERLNLPSSIEIAQMEIKVRWVIKDLIPKESIVMLHSIGGVGKSYLLYKIAKAVANNESFFDLDTLSMPVFYIDFENPLAEIIERMKKIGGCENLKIWHLGHEPAPIRFDTDDWKIYKAFPPGLLIIDSLRSSHFLEENSSKDASVIMARFKEIRSIGFTIILIHHESKAGSYRGSTAWFDLSDHILKFSRVRKIGSDEDVNEDDFDLPIRLGLGGKSRFSSAMDFKPMYFKFENHDLCLVEDPELKLLTKMQGHIEDGGSYYNDLYKKVSEDVELRDGNKKMGKNRFDRLLKKGDLVVPSLWKKDEISTAGKSRTIITKKQG